MFLFYIKKNGVSYQLSSSTTVTNEGTSITITLDTVGVQVGTVVPYTLSGTGITSADFGLPSLFGSFVVTGDILSGTASVTLNVDPDQLTEGSESAMLRLDNGRSYVNFSIVDTSKSRSYLLNASAVSTDEGGTITYTLLTENVPDGTTLDYNLSGLGITSGDYNGLASGSFVVYNNTATFDLPILADELTEGNETITVALTNGLATVSVVIVDTSKTKTYSLVANPTTTDEGTSVAVTLTTENVTSGTSIPYSISGVTSADISGASLSGAFVVSNGIATASFDIAADVLAEGAETATLALGNGAASVSFGINDTSYPIGYTLSSTSTNTNEGTDVTISLATIGIANGTVLPYTITGVDSADINGASLTGSFTVSNNSASTTLSIVADQLTEGTEYLTLALDSGSATITVTIVDTSRTKKYTMSSSAPSVDEGSDITFTLTTENVADGTILPYTISGVTSADINGASLTGTLSVVSNTATKVLTITSDLLTEGVENLTVALDGGLGSSSVAINDTSRTQGYTLGSSAASTDEGTTVTITLTTENIVDGATVPYTITGVTSADISGVSLTGAFNILSNVATVDLTIAADQLTEGSETLTLTLDNGKSSTAIVLVDTSRTKTYALAANPTSVNEGTSVSITLTTENVSDGTELPYTITGINGADLTAGSLTGSFIVTAGTASTSFTLATDQLTEGNETATITLTGGLGSTTFTVIDTSKTPTYTLSRSATSINEGESVTINLVTTDVFDNTVVAYTITGVTSADIAGASLTGTMTVVNNAASFTITSTADQTTEGTETVTVSLDDGSSSTTVTLNDTSKTRTYSLTSGATTINEGNNVTVTLTTTNVPDNTLVPYTISGTDITSADIDGASLTGNFNVVGNTATTTLVITSDAIVESAESLVFALDGGLGSVTITLNDPVLGTADLGLTTLFIKADGTNNAQNNTFVDSSSNNLAVTRVGNVTQGTFTPWSSPIGEWSVYFDGTADYLTAVSNAAFGFGAGDFTVEAWAFPTGNTVYGTLIDFRTPGGSISQDRVLLAFSSANNFTYYLNGASRITSGAVSAGMWHHIALCRSSGVTRLFVDGVQQGTNYADTTSKGTTADLTIGLVGDNRAATANIWKGYISNVRVIKSAVYTTNFTTPSSPLTSVVNGTQASLLTCNGYNFTDMSSTAVALSVVGKPTIDTFSPYIRNSSYDPSIHGGSAYLNSADGTNDYLKIANNAALQFGTGDFTIEMWAYVPTTSVPLTTLYSKRASNGSTTGVVLYLQTTMYPMLFVAIGGGWGVQQQSSIICKYRSWNHIAVTRVGTTFRMFINGKLGATATASGAISDDNSMVGIGADDANGGGSSSPTCYIADVNLTKGIAKYTADFVLPTAPNANVVGSTSALLGFTNAGISDSIKRNVIETVGNTKVSTTVSKFGGASMLFDGSGDWLSIPETPAVILTTGDFSIDCWMYLSRTPTNVSAGGIILFSKDGVAGTTSPQYRIYITPSMSVVFEVSVNSGSGGNNVVSTTASAVVLNTWAHVAVARVGTNLLLFVNGVLKSTVAQTITMGSNQHLPLLIGSETGQAADTNFQGYIDNFRIVKGKSLFTTNFDPAAIVY